MEVIRVGMEVDKEKGEKREHIWAEKIRDCEKKWSRSIKTSNDFFFFCLS